jgi:hypothetical protein
VTMKAVTSFTVLCLLLNSSSARDPLSQIVISPRPNSKALSVPPYDASLILSHHLGLSQYEILGDSHRGFWDALNLNAGREYVWREPEPALIVLVEGDDIRGWYADA